MLARWTQRTACSSTKGSRRPFVGQALIGPLLAVLAGAAACGQDIEPAPPGAPGGQSEPLESSSAASGQQVVPSPTEIKPDTTATPGAGDEGELKFLDAAIQRHDSAAMRIRRAQVLMRLREFKRAIADLDHALAQDPSNPLAVRTRARCRLRLALAGDESSAEPRSATQTALWSCCRAIPRLLPFRAHRHAPKGL